MVLRTALAPVEPTADANAAAPEPVAGDQTAVAATQSFALGAQVTLVGRPAFLKTADPMPMLRPPDLVDDGEVGQVVAQRSQQTLAVRFRRGTFLLTAAALQLADGT